jgi:hypothetical protein
VGQNLPEIRARFSHGFRSGLAESDAVPFARSFQNDLIALGLHDEVITGNRAPAEAAINL